MRPATRSTFDVLYWLRSRDWASSQSREAPFLLKLLYLAQALYAASHKQRKLMPATFLATASGPIEPDIFMALENNISIGKALPPSSEVEAFLTSFHDGFRDKGMAELDMILGKDTALRSAAARGRNSEISLPEMAAAYKRGVPAVAGTGGSSPLSPSLDGAGRSILDAAPNPEQEVRFTADGRSVTRWMPKKRIVSKDRPVLN